MRHRRWYFHLCAEVHRKADEHPTNEIRSFATNTIIVAVSTHAVEWIMDIAVDSVSLFLYVSLHKKSTRTKATVNKFGEWSWGRLVWLWFWVNVAVHNGLHYLIICVSVHWRFRFVNQTAFCKESVSVSFAYWLMEMVGSLLCHAAVTKFYRQCTSSIYGFI